MTSLDAEHLPWLARTKDKKTGQATHDLNPDSEEEDSSSLRRKIPNVPVPDLRFEQSFLLTLKPFIKARNKQAEPEAVRPHGKVEAVDSLAMVQPVATNDVFAAHQLDIEWGNVVWITIRDQLLSPLAQGAAWGGFSLVLGLLWGSSRFVRAGVEAEQQAGSSTFSRWLRNLTGRK